MKWFPVVLCVFLAAVITTSVCLLPMISAPNATESRYTADSLYEEYMPCVVEVYAKQTLFSKGVSRGTGFFISNDGLLVTAAHVIYFEDDDAIASQVRVSIGDEEHFYKARVVKVDLANDVALLKIMQFADLAAANGYAVDSAKAERLNRYFKHVTLDYDYEHRTGDLVFTLGNPGRFKDVVSQGMIISKRIVDLEMEDDLIEFKDMVLTSLYVRPGSSGGPVFNGAGRVIGVITVGTTSGPMSLYQKAKYVKAMLDDKSDTVVISKQHKMSADSKKGKNSGKKTLLP